MAEPKRRRRSMQEILADADKMAEEAENRDRSKDVPEPVGDSLDGILAALDSGSVEEVTHICRGMFRGEPCTCVHYVQDAKVNPNKGMVDWKPCICGHSDLTHKEVTNKEENK